MKTTIDTTKEYSMFEYYGVGKNPGPLMQKSEQNQEWERNRPDMTAHNNWIKERKQYIANFYKPKAHKYKRKYTNNLTSHSGESKVSRADKMSGMKYKIQGKTKTFTKEFYTSKRRMFLKNPNNWEKI